MKWWKLLGLAGVVGATVTGIAVGTRTVQRRHRQFREADIDELRSRLHARVAEAGSTPPPAGA